MIAILMAAATLVPAKLALPAPAPVFMDYLAVSGGQIWVPAGNTGQVFVLDTKTRKFRSIGGFPTKEGRNGRQMGPSSATAGDGVVYVGNRGDSTVCAFESRTLAKRGCVTLPSTPDGTFYVAPTREVWVTTPRDESITVLEFGASPKIAAKIALQGAPEGYAVDAARGLVYTNLEDKNRTLQIDARTRQVTATWDPGCGQDGPRGLALDAKRGLLLVACTDAVVSLDTRTGARKGRLATGQGVDNIDYAAGKVYAAAGRDERLTVANVADDGTMTESARAAVGKGSRVVVVADDGTAYVADSTSGALLVVKP